MFKLRAPFKPAGDQPEAIARLLDGLRAQAPHQTLLGVTGSGKTFTLANVIAEWTRPTLVISHNKTLAAQLYAEFRGFFPENAVEYFVSYFDYYQPEAYIPHTDTFIEKDSSVNDEIERMRLAAMSSVLSRRDVIVVASVSCIYGIGSREDYEALMLPLRPGMELGRDRLLARLVELLYTRNDIAFERGQFRVRGDTVDLCPAQTDTGLRIEFFGDCVERLTRFDRLTGRTLESLSEYVIFPGKQFITQPDKMKRALTTIREELTGRIQWMEQRQKLLEAQRVKMRTEFDLEMMEELGYCSGIENYSRHISGRPAGSRSHTLIDFFSKDYLLIVDESHATLPQIQGMHAGDRSRKEVLVEHGFRLPSALDNRPMNFTEFKEAQGPTLYASATPAELELGWSSGRVVEQIIRPTGLVDPAVTVKPLQGQIDDLMDQSRRRIERKERVLVTTLTKRTAEQLTDYLRDMGINVRYLHCDFGAIERVEILRALRQGDIDVLVGINLLREGLDLPEVSLVAILDADKEGYLRSTTALMQTAGRAARHLSGEVILYADVMTRSIQQFIALSQKRRERQLAYNAAHGITPRQVTRAVEESLASRQETTDKASTLMREAGGDLDVSETLRELEGEMAAAAEKLEFEKAALLRDQINQLKHGLGESPIGPQRRQAHPGARPGRGARR